MVNAQAGVDFHVGLESFSTFVFGFLEEDALSEKISSTSDESENCGEPDDEDSMAGSTNNFEEDKEFWESKYQVLQATLIRSNATESKIRTATKEVLRERKQGGCKCRRQVADICRDCLQREISAKLRMAGYNCIICKSKWKSSPDIPSGEHTYLEVLDNSNPKKEEVRVIIEINFRAEFEMARANGDYNKLISRLPEVFVGKAERLYALIRVLCLAAKKCMNDQKMHMGPWRKYKYMKAKWSGSCERMSIPLTRHVDVLHRLPKPVASMLTYDLVDNLPVLHCMKVN